MRRESQRLGRLIADLLLLARIDEHGLALRREDVDLDDLAYTERERLCARRPDLTVRTQLAPVRVTGDAHDLGRALRNLADNAAHHARARGASCGSGPRTGGVAWRSPTTGRACPPPSGNESSNGSSGSTKAVRAPTAEAAWACRSPARSSRRTAGPCGCCLAPE